MLGYPPGGRGGGARDPYRRLQPISSKARKCGGKCGGLIVFPKYIVIYQSNMNYVRYKPCHQGIFPTRPEASTESQACVRLSGDSCPRTSMPIRARHIPPEGESVGKENMPNLTAARAKSEDRPGRSSTVSRSTRSNAYRPLLPNRRIQAKALRPAMLTRRKKAVPFRPVQALCSPPCR